MCFYFLSLPISSGWLLNTLWCSNILFCTVLMYLVSVSHIFYHSMISSCSATIKKREDTRRGTKREKVSGERQGMMKKHPLIHSVTQLPWWSELYLTMWRTFSASTFAVSHLHLFQCTELKDEWFLLRESEMKCVEASVWAWGQSREFVWVRYDRLDCNGSKWLRRNSGGWSSP